MALSSGVVGARHLAQQITWTDEDGTVLDLTSATITGVKRNTGDNTSLALDGTLALVTATSGIFSWTYGAVDVGAAGKFEVQFTATYTGGATDLERTLVHNWEVIEALAV